MWMYLKPFCWGEKLRHKEYTGSGSIYVKLFHLYEADQQFPKARSGDRTDHRRVIKAPLWYDRNVWYMGTFIFQSSLNYTLKTCAFI